MCGALRQQPDPSWPELAAADKQGRRGRCSQKWQTSSWGKCHHGFPKQVGFMRGCCHAEKDLHNSSVDSQQAGMSLRRSTRRTFTGNRRCVFSKQACATSMTTGKRWPERHHWLLGWRCSCCDAAGRVENVTARDTISQRGCVRAQVFVSVMSKPWLQTLWKSQIWCQSAPGQLQVALFS